LSSFGGESMKEKTIVEKFIKQKFQESERFPKAEDLFDIVPFTSLEDVIRVFVTRAENAIKTLDKISHLRESEEKTKNDLLL
jgi:hypothetical protein